MPSLHNAQTEAPARFGSNPVDCADGQGLQLGHIAQDGVRVYPVGSLGPKPAAALRSAFIAKLGAGRSIRIAPGADRPVERCRGLNRCGRRAVIQSSRTWQLAPHSHGEFHSEPVGSRSLIKACALGRQTGPVRFCGSWQRFVPATINFCRALTRRGCTKPFWTDASASKPSAQPHVVTLSSASVAMTNRDTKGPPIVRTAFSESRNVFCG